MKDVNDSAPMLDGAIPAHVATDSKFYSERCVTLALARTGYADGTRLRHEVSGSLVPGKRRPYARPPRWRCAARRENVPRNIDVALDALGKQFVVEQCPCGADKYGAPPVVHGGRGKCLRPYLPYVGNLYRERFEDEDFPRVAFYGMAQNLAGNRNVALDYGRSEDGGLDRMAAAWKKDGLLDIQPHTTGHAQLLVAFVLRHEARRAGADVSGCVTEQAVFTNFVKHSFGRKTDVNPPSWMYPRSFELHVRPELEALRPTVVLSMGAAVSGEFSQHEEALTSLGVRHVGVAHSSPRVTRGIYGHVSRLLDGWQGVDSDFVVGELIAELEPFEFRLGPQGLRVGGGDERLRDLVRADWLYFGLMKRRVELELSRAKEAAPRNSS